MVGERQDRQWWTVALVASSLCLVAPLVAQGTSVAADTARLIASSERVRVLGDEGIRLAVLDKAIALSLDDVPLRDALEAIARQAGLKVFYGRDFVSDQRRVSLQAANITVTDALTVALRGTDLDALVSMSGSIVLVRHGQKRLAQRQQGGGMIAGRAMDGVTLAPLNQVAVRVEGSTLGTVTTSDGRYTIRGITPGPYRITARRVGYTPLTKSVLVATDSTATVDFALTAAPTRLEEMVTTAVGDQRRVELGNSIATINVDSVARTAPVTQLTDVLSGRAPGVQVLQDQGQVGSGVRIRIRGLSSFTLSNDPIIYVDGIRLDGSGTPVYSGAPASETTLSFTKPSRLNDIDPADIASIDVLKGPSAATEYGTDAANGVIVIKTKHGQAGSARWDFHAEQGVSTIPTTFPLIWHAFGHTTDGSNTPVECPRTFGFGPTVANGGCVVDSVTTYQPLNHASTSIFGTGNESRTGGQVSGGTQQLQYFVAGAYDGATGVLQLPPFFRHLMATQDQPVPAYMQTPNTMTQGNVRSRVTATLGTVADVGVSAAYIANNQRSGNDGFAIYDAAFGWDGNRNDGLGGYGNFGPIFAPTTAFAITGSEGIRRFAGGTNATWRPTSWLSTRAAIGIDYGSRSDESFFAPGPDPLLFSFIPGGSGTGYHTIGNIGTTLYTIDVGATATAPLSSAIALKTSVGFQYNDHTQSGERTDAYGLTANGSLNGASFYRGTQLDSGAKTVGSYIEESVGWRERLFLTGALRVDEGSGFGARVNEAVYPKASLSWEALQTSSSRLRLRAAYGESGVQPPNGATLTLLSPATVSVGGNTISGDTGSTVGNARLKPERSAEIETGFDASVANDRATFEFTYYRKQTHNTIVANVLPGSYGGSIEYENLGSVLNYGIEGSLTLQILDTRPVAWSVTAGGSLNQNRLVSIASGVPPIDPPFFPFELQYQQVVGFPLFGLWAPELRYGDANHDGFIEPTEVSVSSALSYQGPSTPTREYTLNTAVSLFDHALQLGTQVDYRGGNKIQNGVQTAYESFPGAAVLNDPHATLAEQARAVLASQINGPYPNPFFEDGSFVRWRELSLTYILPFSVTRMLHVRSSSITLLGRNLALWTRYGGADPEVVTANTAIFGTAPDGVFDRGATPLARSWAVRVAVGVGR